jgi:BolA protein
MIGRVNIIEERLRAAFAPQDLQIVDESSKHIGHPGARDGGHYAVTIVSAKFAGVPTLSRHRLIYDTLSDLMTKDIHALSIHAYAPDER